jgi:hypothetical protein
VSFPAPPLLPQPATPSAAVRRSAPPPAAPGDTQGGYAGHIYPPQAEARSFTIRLTVTDSDDATAACAVPVSVPGPTAPGG